MKNNPPIFIVGMHRSGTSLTAQWLHASGISMGTVFSEDTVGNDDGHFEDMDFLLFHMDILAARCKEPNGLFNFFKITTLASDKKEELNTLLASKKKAMYWGIKDPRLCLFLDLYEELLQSDFYLLFLVRSPLQVIDSLIRRDLKKLKANFKDTNRIAYTTFSVFYYFRYIRLMQKVGNTYLKAWIFYNKCVVEFVQSISTTRYAVVEHSALLQQNNALESFLNSKGYPILTSHFSSIFKPKKVTTTYPVLLTLLLNQQLLNTAQALFNKIKELKT